MSKPTKKYQIWVNYGLDGWQPFMGFDSAEQALDWLMENGSGGSECVITKRIKFVPDESDEEDL